VNVNFAVEQLWWNFRAEQRASIFNLLLSKHALASTWVEDEFEAALEKEQRQQRDVLLPLRLDEQVMQTIQIWAAKLRRTLHISDFTC
jgi:hypothetical protein